MPVSEAFCPAGISSFFEICTTDPAGQPLTDPAIIGARGGGFAISRGVHARVAVRKSPKTRFQIRINTKLAPEARTTLWAIDRLMQKATKTLDVQVDLRVSVPIAAGYGTSAAGTAATCLALADAARVPVTYNELGRITHIAEVVNHTGLGTAYAVFVGGFVLVTEPGAPGIGAVDRLLFPRGHSVVCAYLEPMPTRHALAQADLANRVNPHAREAMARIIQEPTVGRFLAESREFSRHAGFQSPDVAMLIEAMTFAGALGATQNMIGKAVHAVVESSNAQRIAAMVKRRFPSATVFVSHLDLKGVRLLTRQKPKH